MGEDDFAEMETAGGGHVHARVGMVDAMKTPEERDAMVQPVPPVEPGIQQDNRAEDARPRRQRDEVEQSAAVALGPLRRRPPQAGEEERGQGGVQDAEKHIPRPVPEPFIPPVLKKPKKGETVSQPSRRSSGTRVNCQRARASAVKFSARTSGQARMTSRISTTSPSVPPSARMIFVAPEKIPRGQSSRAAGLAMRPNPWWCPNLNGARLCHGDQPQHVEGRTVGNALHAPSHAEQLRLVEDDTAALRGRVRMRPLPGRARRGP